MSAYDSCLMMMKTYHKTLYIDAVGVIFIIYAGIGNAKLVTFAFSN